MGRHVAHMGQRKNTRFTWENLTEKDGAFGRSRREMTVNY
jgi:hypothetical protein